jgi:peptidoglycan/LPS O-acetylase OafA/YrhL
MSFNMNPNFPDRLLGDISYPVYITHFAVVQFVKELFSTDIAGSAVSVSVACLSAFIVAWAAFVFFDMPARRWLSSRLLIRKTTSLSLAPRFSDISAAQPTEIVNRPSGAHTGKLIEFLGALIPKILDRFVGPFAL